VAKRVVIQDFRHLNKHHTSQQLCLRLSHNIPMPAEEIAVPPSLQWRAASTVTIALTGLASKAFLNFACTKDVYGLDGFVKVLDERKDVAGRERGLLTGIFCLLPFRNIELC
jgi:hypothetical protein